MTVRAVLFDVDYTLLRPGVIFDAEGYQRNGLRFGLELDPARWPQARRAANAAVEERRTTLGHAHDMGIIPAVTRAVVGALAGEEVCRTRTDACEACAQYQADQWWDLDNFTLFDDVLPCLERLHAAALRVGLVSNTSRKLSEAVSHFGLGEFVTATMASAQIGIMKPEPAIFLAVLDLVGADPSEAAMVGDNHYDDVQGALACGFALAVLLDRRARQRTHAQSGVPPHEPTITSLAELPALLGV
jgi:HAD superfamily hydrolase (TIGR01549 family)